MRKGEPMNDLISRQKAKDAIDMALDHIDHVPPWVYDNLLNALNEVPSVQPELANNSQKLDKEIDECNDCIKNGGDWECDRVHCHKGDAISRQAAIDAINTWDKFGVDERSRIVRWHEGLEPYVHLRDVLTAIVNLPPAQPEQHTCVNCDRTANNGGWYADGETRCPIEEHYALPKDGYCHLWEKRNVTDDDYPERRTDEQ